MKRLLVILATIAIGAGAHAQIESRPGTLVVVYFANNKIAMAADSGSGGEWAGEPDKICKLTAIDHRLLFATSGAATVTSPGDPSLGWNNVEEARSAYAQASKMGGAVLANTVQIWTTAVTSKWNRLLSARQVEMMKVISSDRDNAGSNAFFAAAVNGMPQLIHAQIAFDPMGTGRKEFAYRIESFTADSCPNHICAIGHAEAVAHYGDLDTESARKEASEWNTQAWPGRENDREALIAIRLVDLGIADPKNGLAPPIDAAVLEPDGNIRWIARKAACPED